MERWMPKVELTKQEQMMMKRLTRVRTLFGFLRLHRHELFDAAFQEELAGMYRDSGAGDEPHPPAMLCMVLLLQGYVGASDAEAVELAVMDLRWQMVLDCLGADAPPFSQGALQSFRERLIAHGMDRVLLEKSVALVRTKAISEAEGKALSKAVRVAVDSRPLVGAGRVEDTINLLGHAARTIVQIVSKITKRSEQEICRSARIPLLLAPSIKAGLDIDWSDPKQKVTAIQIVEQQVSSLHRWVERHLDEELSAPLTPYIRAITQVREQDLETTKEGVRIRAASLPSGASRSRTRRCGTAARARAKGSTDTRSTSRETSTCPSSSRAPSRQPTAPKKKAPSRSAMTSRRRDWSSSSCTSTAPT